MQDGMGPSEDPASGIAGVKAKEHEGGNKQAAAEGQKTNQEQFDNAQSLVGYVRARCRNGTRL